MLEYRNNFLSVLCFTINSQNNNCFFLHDSRLPVICISVQDYGFCVTWFITELDLCIPRLKVTYVTELFLKICICAFL